MSEIRANTISDAAGTGPVTLTGQYAAKAWVNFNGTGTIAARDSFNVSSLTDNGTGDYTVNFTNAFGAADYAVSNAVGKGTSSLRSSVVYGFTTSQFETSTYNNSGSTTPSSDDISDIHLVAHGDLA